VSEETKPGPVGRQPRWRAPAGATDCHCHVFGPESRYPYTAVRAYTPPDASLDEYRALLAGIGFSRGVIVQPSVYGTDNRASEAGIKALGSAGRGVAVLAADVGAAELRRLDGAGFRGVRFNLATLPDSSDASLEAMARKLAPLGWHIQIFAEAARLAAMAGRLAALPVEVVIDHLGLPELAAGVAQPGVQAVLRLLGGGRTWLKLSGAYRVDPLTPRWPGATPFAKAYLAANPDRLVWGTDWPHPNLAGPMPDDGELFDLLLDWVPDEATRTKILVENPARLYRFD